VSGIDHSKMYYATDDHGSTWARGATYKSRFDAAGATYFPAFGERQPHNVPHVLTPDRVTLAGEPLAFAHDAGAARDADHVAFDRGSFVESYDLTPQSIEQSFVFSSLPERGELVLHIPVASELEALDSANGLEFRGENGRVTYGRATAIDATGKRVTAETGLEDGAIVIRVDASFVAAATMPLVVDPIVSTFVINGASSNDFYSDAAYDPQAHEWIVASEEKFSATDFDVLFARMTDQGLVIGGAYVDLSTDSWESVHVANNAQTEMFLIVATVISGVHSSIHGYMFHATSPGITQFVIADESLGSVYFPVVGGDPAIGSGATYFCVAYTRVFSATDWDILARLVTPNGTLVGTQPIFLSNSSATLDIYPAISKSNDHNEWMIAWQRNNGTSNAPDIWGGRIRWDGTVTANPFQITNFSNYEESPSVSSPVHGTLRYLVAWQREILPGTGHVHDVIATLFDGNTQLSQLDLYLTDAYSDLDQISASVDSDGSHFLVARSDGIGTDYDLVATDLYVFGNTLGISQHALPLDISTPTTEGNPCVVSAAASGATDASLKHSFLVTWNSGPAGGSADIRGGFVDTLDGGGAEPFCSPDGINLNCPCGNGSPGHGCKNSANTAGALLSASGSASPTNDSFVLHATGLPGNALCIFLQGTQSATPVTFGDGVRCIGGTLLRLKSVAASAGSVSLPGPSDPPISTLGGVPASGGTRYYQAWYRDPAVFCTSDTFNISNGLIVTWAP
jgi:hypothetical protein